MKVADFIINYLADLGVDNIFEVYGAANGDLIDAFTRNQKTKYVSVMHEQAGGFAAEGYAKISGKVGVAIATSGPGGMNFVTPIGNCYYDSVPCLFLTGQINSQFLRPDPDIRQVGFQETDIVGIVRPITKYAKMLTKAEDVKYELEKALFLAQEGRPGPVLLDIPLDVQKKDIDPEALVGFDSAVVKHGYDQTQVDKKIEAYLGDLEKAKRPVIIVGAGVRIAGAVGELIEVGKLLKIPIFPTWNALDIVTSDYEYYGGRIGTYGGSGRNFGLQNSDLVLAIGSRISGRITGGNLKTFLREAKKYVVDVDEALLQKKLQQVQFDEAINCDALLFLQRLRTNLTKTDSHMPDFSGWVKKVMGWKQKYDPVLPEYYGKSEHVNPYVFIRQLSEEMKASDIFVGDCGGNIVVSNHAFETKHGQRYITNNGNSPMGFSFAGAMGAWFAAKPGQNVVCIIGDGGFNMNIQELQTFKNYGVKVKTFILNNHVYGITKQFEETNFEGRFEACGPKGYNPPDFIKIVEAYGVKNLTIKNNDEIKEKIREVLEMDEAVVCDVDCHDWYQYAPRVFGWKTPIEDMHPYLPRSEFRENMLIDPVEGWETPQEPGKIKKATS
ncbi:thiamine pyrophosphate-binding protein [bacterium]|nr:MAG: thiamine pyrophosphate-binding protein [bacterium]